MRALISISLGVSILIFGTKLPVFATDTFQNSITLNQSKLIEAIEGICPTHPTRSKQIRINDAIQKNTETYLLWSYTCDSTSTGVSTIMISIKRAGEWIAYPVSSDRKFYVDRNYLGAPNFVDLNDVGVAIIWADFTDIPGRSKLMGKIYGGGDASLIADAELFTIATSTDCNIGNILPASNSLGISLFYVTNNGGSEDCMGNLYATRFLSGTWTTPNHINDSVEILDLYTEEVSDLYKENNLAVTSTGEAYICYTTRLSYERLGNQVNVFKFSDGVASLEFSREYPDIAVKSAHYCSIEIDQFDQPHLLVAEIAWTRTATDTSTGISANPASINFREFTIIDESWQETEGSLDVINLNLDDSFSYASFCNQCQERMTLIVTSESSKIKLYSYGSDKNWTMSRNFNEDYDQDVQNIQEVWGNPTLGYTFLISNYAEELSGDFGSQKGHFLDVKPTFSPASVNKLLFSDSIYEVASQIFLDEFESIFTRLTSRGVIKIGNSIVSMWEDLGSGSTPPRTIFIERVLKENPSCTDSNFAPGKPTELAAASVYTTAILSFVLSQCGSTATQATVEVKNVTTGATREVVIANPGLSFEIPNLEQGNSYAFKVKLTNSYGASNFTSYSNLVVATRPVSRVPQVIIVPPTEALDTSNKSETIVIPDKDVIVAQQLTPELKVNESTILKLNSLGLRSLTIASSNNQKTSAVFVSSSPNSKLTKPLKISSKKTFEVNVMSFTTERVKAQLIIGKKVVYLGYVTPSVDSVLKLPPFKFKPGKYMFKFTSLSGTSGFVSIAAR
jgi:Uma2 family endonuclease